MWHNSYAICELSGFLTYKCAVWNEKCHFCFLFTNICINLQLKSLKTLAQHTVRRVLIKWTARNLTPGIMRSGVNQSS